MFFFIFVFSYFIFSFYIESFFGLVSYHPESYNLNEITVIENTYKRHTFTQLLEYGSITYGLFYSSWVASNAAAYASLGFLLVLIIENKFLALSIPFLLYLLGSFVMGAFSITKFRFADSVFPFNYIQQPIWTAFIPFLFLVVLCLILVIIVSKRMDNIV